MADELRKAARELLDAWDDDSAQHTAGVAAIEAIRAALAEPNCPKMLDSSEPSREPTIAMVDEWQAAVRRIPHLDDRTQQFAALAYAAGYKAGRVT
jgi:hypothetical protein